MDRLPFQATQAAAAYQNIRTLPVSILLDNVRSMYNVGAFFRTADAAGIEKLYLCGITSYPPKKAISKTALAHLLHHVGGSYSFPAGCNFENGLVTRFLSA
jgi:tRNA G18 (ribose-2'-O)-methylase SpoU